MSFLMFTCSFHLLKNVHYIFFTVSLVYQCIALLALHCKVCTIAKCIPQ